MLVVALAWLNKRLNKPGVIEHYLMGIRQEIRGIFTNPGRLDGFKIEFSFDPPLLPEELPEGFPKPMTKESIEEIHAYWRSKGIWT